MKFPKANYTPPYINPITGNNMPGRATVDIEDWERLRLYNIKLENYLCQCIVALTQNNIALPDAPAPVEEMLREKFIAAIKGE